MAIEVRKTLVWATIAAAIISAALLASSGGNAPRADASDRAGTVGAALAVPAH